MKILPPLLGFLILTSPLHAANDQKTKTGQQIEIAFCMADDPKDITDLEQKRVFPASKITLQSGQQSSIKAARELRTPPIGSKKESLSMPVGFLLDAYAEVDKEGKIIYSCLATYRNFKGSKMHTAKGVPVSDHPTGPVSPDNFTGYFKTYEFTFSGRADPETLIVAKFEDNITAFIQFTILNPDGSSKK
jgi:hypothetical protein